MFHDLPYCGSIKKPAAIGLLLVVDIDSLGYQRGLFAAVTVFVAIVAVAILS